MIQGINHITIAVRSIESAFRFYRDVVQLAPVMKSSYSAYFRAGPIWIALVEEKSFTPSNNYAHIAFDVAAESYPAICQRLREVPVEEWQVNKTEGDSLYFYDDSRNKLELHFSTLERRMATGKREWGSEVQWFV